MFRLNINAENNRTAVRYVMTLSVLVQHDRIQNDIVSLIADLKGDVIKIHGSRCERGIGHATVDSIRRKILVIRKSIGSGSGKRIVLVFRKHREQIYVVDDTSGSRITVLFKRLISKRNKEIVTVIGHRVSIIISAMYSRS